MLDYTRILLKKTIDDIKRVYYVCTLSTQILYIGYLLYAVISASGILLTNLLMLIVSSAYFVFFCLTLMYEGLKKNKKIQKYVKGYYKFIKHIIQLIVIAVSVYNLVSVGTSGVITIQMLVVAVMIFSFIIQVILEAIVSILTKRFALFREAIAADLEPLKKPIDTAKDLIRRIKGDEPKEEIRPPSRARMLLNALLSKKRAAEGTTDSAEDNEAHSVHK